MGGQAGKDGGAIAGGEDAGLRRVNKTADFGTTGVEFVAKEGGWALALCSVRAQREGKKDFRWEGQDAVQQQMMPAVAQSLVLTR